MALAAVYVLAVACSTLAWLLQGAYSGALWVTLALTLPWSPLGYMVLYFAGSFLLGSSAAVEAAVSWSLILLLFPGMAVGNVLVARALWRARQQRQPGRESGHTR